MQKRADEVPRVVLVGMMGSGKTTVGKLLAQRLGGQFADSDEEIESSRGMTIAQIFETDGEEGFRRIESEVLLSLLARDGPDVVAAGGGAVLSEANRDAMRDSSTVVWLRTGVATLAARVGSGDTRPLLAGRALERLEEINREREEIYAPVADVVVDTDDLPPESVTESVLEALRTHLARDLTASRPS
ncbi:MAG: shikimate kinase [Acidimicrobiales bacterium]